jgi:hypothetical protein
LLVESVMTLLVLKKRWCPLRVAVTVLEVLLLVVAGARRMEDEERRRVDRARDVDMDI